MTGLIVRLGAFLLFTGLLMFGIAAAIGQYSFAAQIALTADFDDANGVGAGDPVRINGVPVGQVTAIEVHEGKARVTMSVDRDRPVPDDSVVGVSWLNLIGMRQLDIVAGTSPDLLQDGDHFRETSSVVDLASFADQLDPFAMTLNPAAINVLLEAIHQTLDGTSGDVGVLVRNLEVVLGTIGQRDEVIHQMIDDYSEITDAMVVADDQFRALLDNLLALTDAYAGTEQLVGDALASATGLTTQLQGFLQRNEDDLSSLLRDLERFVGFAADHTDDVVALLRAFPPGLEGLFGVLRHGEYIRVHAYCLNATGPPCEADPLFGLFPAGQVSSADEFQSLLLGSAGGPA